MTSSVSTTALQLGMDRLVRSCRHTNADNVRSNLSLVSECMIGQCTLVYPQEPGKEKKFRMVRRLLYSWHPENAELFQRDRALCEVIFEWLQQLQNTSSLWDERFVRLKG